MGHLKPSFLCLSLALALQLAPTSRTAQAAPALERYELSPDQIVGIVKKRFRKKTGIELNFDRTELVTSASGRKFRDGISQEDARCFRLTALALEQILVQNPDYVDLIRNIAPDITISSQDNSAHAIPDEKLSVTMKPSTYVDLAEMPINTVRIQPIISKGGCQPIPSQEFDRQLSAWSGQVAGDSGAFLAPSTSVQAGPHYPAVTSSPDRSRSSDKHASAQDSVVGPTRLRP